MKPNKGQFKKGEHKSQNTEFFRGQKAHNKLSIGFISTRKHKQETPRQWIKIEEPNVWIEYARFVVLKNKGFIPKGYVVHHVDGNTMNDNVNNLVSLSRAEHLKAHKIQEEGQLTIKNRIKK